jgi:hypothetical protein
MRSTTKRHRRLTVACALISALTLGGVYAGQSIAADSPSGGESSTNPPKDDSTDSTDWERQDDASREYAECMRDNGLEDFPDIVIYTAKDGRGVKVKMDGGKGKHPAPISKEYRKAAQACRHVLEDIGVDLPVPPDEPPNWKDRPSPPDCGQREGSDERSAGLVQSSSGLVYNS